VPHKGQDAAIEALAHLSPNFPNLRYLLIGCGEDETRLRALAVRLGVDKRVVFAGALPDEDLAEAYASATVYVGLSRIDNDVDAEGFGISFVEAGASGVPCVAGDSGGVRSAVRHGETGFVVPADDSSAVAVQLRVLLEDPGLRARMGEAARWAVENYYNWDRVASETLDFVSRVAGRRVRA
jgi:phosphatidylinositol alpha-1,6-mannosyltransferase